MSRILIIVNKLFLLNVIMLNVIMLSAVMLSVIMLSVAALKQPINKSSLIKLLIYQSVTLYKEKIIVK